MQTIREQRIQVLRDQLIAAKDKNSILISVHGLIKENDTAFRQYCENIEIDESWDFLASIHAINLVITNQYLEKYLNDSLTSYLNNTTLDVCLNDGNRKLQEELLQNITLEGINQIFKVYFLGDGDLLNLPHKALGKISNSQCKTLYCDIQKKIELGNEGMLSPDDFSNEKILLIAALLNVKGVIEELLANNINTVEFEAFLISESNVENTGISKPDLFFSELKPQQPIKKNEANSCCCQIF